VVAEAVALAGSAAVALDVLELGTHPEGEKRKRSIRQAAARYPGASRRRLRPQGTPTLETTSVIAAHVHRTPFPNQVSSRHMQLCALYQPQTWR
jgi:hypothetical protein